MENTQGTAIVTGGQGALGSEIVRGFRRKGFTVAVPVREAPGPELRPDSRGIFIARADLTSERQVRAFFRAVETTCGPVTTLVNAAGGYRGGGTVEETRAEDWDSVLSMNLTTAFLMSREALKSMKGRGKGRIVNIAAMTGLRPEAGKSAYAVAKRGVITLSETMAAEVQGTGITVNVIAPGVILTDANRAWMSPEIAAKAVPPGEIAALVLFLCSAEAGSINGNTIMMPGGG